MAKTSDAMPAEKLALYEKLVATIPEVERKGASVPYTSVNGHMFSYLGKTGTLALRLPEPERQRFLDKYKTTLCTAYGVVQKEYVDVPGALLAKTAELATYFAASHAYVASLKAKPTTRKPAAAKSTARTKSTAAAKSKPRRPKR